MRDAHYGTTAQVGSSSSGGSVGSFQQLACAHAMRMHPVLQNCQQISTRQQATVVNRLHVACKWQHGSELMRPMGPAVQQHDKHHSYRIEQDSCGAWCP